MEGVVRQLQLENVRPTNYNVGLDPADGQVALAEQVSEQEEQILTLMRDKRRRSPAEYGDLDNSLLAELQGNACDGSCLFAGDLRAQLGHALAVSCTLRADHRTHSNTWQLPAP